MLIILSTAFISCGKITNDPDPKKDDSTSTLGDTVAIEITVKVPDNTVLIDQLVVNVYNNALPDGYCNQVFVPAKAITCKISGDKAVILIGKESRIGLNVHGVINNHSCEFKLVDGDDYGIKPITLKKGLNKVTFEYETWLML